jgi:hypothetical protein
MWANGACSQEVNHLMPAGGSDAVWGFIGPATAAQLQATYISVVQDAGGASPLTVPLHTVMPHLGASWLIAQGG